MKMEVYMKNLSERIGYKTLKAQYYESLEKPMDAIETDEDYLKEDENVEIDSSKSEEIRLRERVKRLQAELNSKVRQEAKKTDKLKLLRTSVLTNLEESVAKPTFEQEVSRLVTQLSFALEEDQICSKDDGSVCISPDIFKELEEKIDTLEQDGDGKQLATKNLNIFRKALESRIQIFPTPDGGRRLSFGGRSNASNSSLKRKCEQESSSRNMRTPVSNLQKPTVGKNSASRRQSQITMGLGQFQTKS